MRFINLGKDKVKISLPQHDRYRVFKTVNPNETLNVEFKDKEETKIYKQAYRDSGLVEDFDEVKTNIPKVEAIEFKVLKEADVEKKKTVKKSRSKKK